jgi:hypothetical protein
MQNAVKLCAVGALYQLLQCGLAITALAQQPAALTLACKGTTTSSFSEDAKPEEISMGLIINFTAHTVQGFGFAAGLMDYPVTITAVNDVMITFGGEQKLPSSTLSTEGSIDRVTGDVMATTTLRDGKTGGTLSQTAYALQCRPAQRRL